MRTLLLLRHGKSDWDADYNGDHQRPLSPRGVRSAKLMGRMIAATDLTPDLVLSSTALRATATAKLASEAGGWGSPIDYVDEFYGSGPEQVIERTSRASGERVLLVGHQPTWSMLVQRLTGASAEMKTASLAVVDLLIAEWSELPDARGVLGMLMHPRRLFGTEWDTGG